MKQILNEVSNFTSSDNIATIANNSSSIMESFKGGFLNIIACMIILSIGFLLIKITDPYLKKIIRKFIIDTTVERFISNFLSYTLKIIVVLMAITKVGVETASLVAMLGAVSFAVGLAFQGALSNFAGGILILTQRPFSVDDYVQISSEEGIVHSISILSTTLHTFDNKVISIPNGEIINCNITNYTKLEERRVDITVTASYSENSQKIIQILKNIANSNKKVLKNPECEVVLSGLADSSVEYTYRVWVKTEDYWDVYFYLLENTKIRFDEEGIEIPYNKLDVNIIK